MQSYQKFEYAIGHWLQKATEHMLGCVLCRLDCNRQWRWMDGGCWRQRGQERSRRQEAGGRRQEAGGRRQEAGQEAGGR